MKEHTNQLELRQMLQADEVSWQDALKIISTSNTPPWKTKEWKIKRDSLIGTNCKQCGASDLHLVLQHTWHPKSLSMLFLEARNKLLNEWSKWKDEHPIQIDLSAITPDINACPKCYSPTIRFRKTTKDWKCVAQKSGVFCHHIFETPIRIVSEAIRKSLSKAAYYKTQEEFDTAFDVGKQVVIAAIDQHARYLSMEDTVTLCKRCAFVEDKTKMVLCKICSKNFHSIRFDRCSKCAGINFETSADETI